MVRQAGVAESSGARPELSAADPALVMGAVARPRWHRRLRRIATLAVTIGAAMTMVLASGAPSFAAVGTGSRFYFSGSTPNWSCGHNVWTGSTHLVFQCDGNLVLYNFSGIAIWASGTNGSGVDEVDFSGSMGALMLVKNGSWYCGIGAWTNGTFGQSSGSLALGGFFEVQDDGNLVVYNSVSKAVWASDTVGGSDSSKHGCVTYYN